MKLFCANCGLQLKLTRRAIPKFGTIIDLVEPHTCLEIPVDPNIIIVYAPVSKGDGKFVESLNKLTPSLSMRSEMNYPEGKSLRPSSMTGTNDLRDRRFDQETKIPSTAPASVLDQIKQMGNSIPSRDLKDDSTDSEMGD
jgi:hypothetical protein